MEMQRILIVEDDTLLQSLYERVLTDAGFEVMIASDARDAVYHIRHCNPDLTLLDINLPDLNGLELLYHLRYTLGMGDLKIMLITANIVALHDDRKTLADGFIEKPIRNHDLVNSCLKVLRGVSVNRS